MADEHETPASDESLVEHVRDGDSAAYAELWRRHSPAARRAAWQFRTVADPDDLVSEAYARILDAIRNGKGPRGAFRPYLFVTVRNLASLFSRAPRDQQVEDFDQLADLDAPADPSIAALDRSLTVRAFRSLPERWQSVLWYTEVEGMRPQEAAPLLGLSANSTAALAYRAREALRTAWLQAHINEDATSEACRWMLAHMAAYSRGTLSERDSRRAKEHIEGCARCLIVSEEMPDIGARLALVLLPIALGAAAGTGYRLMPESSIAASSRDSPKSPPSPRSPGTGWAIGAGVTVVTVAAAAAGVWMTLPPPVAQPPVEQSSPELPPRPPAKPAPERPVTTPPTPPAPVEPITDKPVTPAPVIPVTPEMPTDPVAAPPIVSTVLTNGQLSRPALEGSAEPLAVIEVRDQSGTLMATVAADGGGAWATGPLDALGTGATELSVIQINSAGAVSKPTVLGPLAFHPVILSPVNGFVVGMSEPFLIEIAGWAGTGMMLAMSGTPMAGGYEEYPLGFDSTGNFTLPVQSFAAPGVVTLTVRYLDADPATTQTVTFTVTP